jgi:hypothetical protein
MAGRVSMRKIVSWMACAWLSGQVLAGSPGYLTRIGPAPLRFQPVLAAVSGVTLPPLPMNDLPPPAERAPATNSLALSAPAAPAKSMGTTTNNPAIAPPATPAAPALVPAPASATNTAPAAVLVPLDATSPPAPTPDKLVHFFTPVPLGTNGTKVVVPSVIFSPPVPANAAPASQATYRTPPN